MHTAIKAGAGILPILAASFVLCTPARAEPNDYVYYPNVVQGEKEIDFKFGTLKAPGGGPRESAASLGFGYGVNSWWFTEVYVKGKRETPDGWHYDAIEWENKFQLTETGKYPVDVGLVVEIERPQDRSEGWELRFGPLFQMELTPKWVTNVNLLFSRNFDAATPSEMAMNYQWQIRYRWKPELEVGAQAFGSLGPWQNWLPSDQQEHKIGPAVFGKIRLGSRQALNYNAAWLVGINANTAHNTLRLQMEYEF
jgi:hypothetical protein